jgi:hypothetical protein
MSDNVDPGPRSPKRKLTANTEFGDSRFRDALCHKDLSHHCNFIIVESGGSKPAPTEVYSRSIG